MKNKKTNTDVDLHTFLDYEIRSSWWAPYVGVGWIQELAAKYFAYKTTRKLARYRKSKVMELKLKTYQNESLPSL